ncbi:leucyl aminopeptidase family protein [Saccharomonospora iraqiensis]|uniref:leucyl aminopeptidase family protein n=1 Tax=Saccharomonospora iraqiensis TaxID=52698 RepID=UPI0004201BFC|nr:leucyl aminopeptidase family protein [Saccharomonospora iraqiensis]
MARSPFPSVPTRSVDVLVTDTARRGTPLAEVVAEGERTPHDAVLDDLSATRAPGEVQVLPGSEGPGWLVGVGAGGPRSYRTAGAAFVRAVQAAAGAEADAGGRPAVTVQVRLPAEATVDEYAAFTTGVVLGGYRFRVTGTEDPPRPRRIRLLTDRARTDGRADAGRTDAGRTDAVARAVTTARATALARDLANAPSNVKTPDWLATTAERVMAGTAGLSVTVRDERWLADNDFGGVLAVGGGSASPPRLVEATYRPRDARTHLLLVGKGITFDSGGISVKPAAGMHLMRTDMSGGAAVLAAVRAIAALRLDVRVTALVPAAENMISGSAFRPGDVVRHHGGRTSEIENTDAEGRLVLADALAYGAARYRPDAVVDVATLTGAMKVALGLRTGGLFASDDDLATRVAEAGARTGEAWWRMPLSDEHAPDVAGDLADVRQAPPGPGGITAALFLREFTAGLPWAHLDIAGPARAETTYAEVVPGGTGFAARTLVELAASYT